MAFLLFIKIIVVKMHIIVIDTSDITSGIDISPYGNFINLSIKSTAEKIIEYRKQNGKFKTIEDLKNVSGIGESKYEKIKEKITVK